MIRLGNLKTTNKDIIEEYPVVSLEYRYLKDSKKGKEDNNNYVVFKKINSAVSILSKLTFLLSLIILSIS